jgi:WD40 repeat protein
MSNKALAAHPSHSESVDEQELQLYDVAEIASPQIAVVPQIVVEVEPAVPSVQFPRGSEVLEQGESGIIREDGDSLDYNSSAFEFAESTPKVSVHSSPKPSISIQMQQEVFMIKNLDTNERFHVDQYVKPMDLSTFNEAKKTWSAEVMIEENKENNVKKDSDHDQKKETEGWLSAVLALAGQKSSRNVNEVSNKVMIKLHKKANSEIGSLRLIQAIEVQTGPIWTMKFSPDANYLAAAGSDGAVRIWTITGSPADIEFIEQLARRKNNPSDSVGDEKSDGVFGERTNSTDIPEGRSIVNLNLIRTFKGHSSDVVDISWSPSNFLLSASLDKSVRLWHVSKDKCLGKFQHADFVTSVAFHPTNSRYFLTGSYDRILRIWSIIEHRVTVYEQTDTIITSSAFSPDGKTVVAGLISGQCVLYKTEGLVYSSQIDCKNRHGKHSKGRKVTGLQFLDNKQVSFAFTVVEINMFV